MPCPLSSVYDGQDADACSAPAWWGGGGAAVPSPSLKHVWCSVIPGASTSVPQKFTSHNTRKPGDSSLKVSLLYIPIARFSIMNF